jgi:pyrroline-5-carboxylate reductase
MGEALVSGLLLAGWDPGDVSLCVRRAERGDELALKTGCSVYLDPVEAIRGRDVIVVAVKPRDVADVLKVLAGEIAESQTVVSLAAGVTTQSYEAQLGAVPVVRAMPNTPALVGEGVTGIAPGNHAGSAHLVAAEEVLGAVGVGDGGDADGCGHGRVGYRAGVRLPARRGTHRGGHARRTAP